MTLLSKNDLDHLRAAQLLGRPLKLERTLGDCTITASVIPGDAVWGQDWLFQVRQTKPGCERIKTCRQIETVAELAAEDW